MQIVDHEGTPVTSTRMHVNGVRLHYLEAGSGEPVVLLHGVPKTSYHWRFVIPLDRKSTRLNSSHSGETRMPSSA